MIAWHAVVAESTRMSLGEPVFVGSREECETKLGELNTMNDKLMQRGSKVAGVVHKDDMQFSVRPVRVVL